MGSDRKRLLDNCSTLVTFLTGVSGVHSDNVMTSSRSLVLKDREECAPTRVQNALRQMMVLHHITDGQVFDGNEVILLSVLFGRLEMMIPALAIDLEMGLCHVSGGFPSSLTAFCTPAHLALFPSERTLRGAIEAWVFHRVALTIGQKAFESNINADGRMLTLSWLMFRSRIRFADNQDVPMPIGTQNEMHRLGGALYWTMQFDLEEVSHFLWDDQVFFVFVQIAVFAVLPQLDGMPLIGLLEAGEADAGNVMLLRSQKTLEGLGETIRKHLHRGGRHMLTLSFERRFQIVLAWKRAILVILCFDGLQHAIVNGARLTQALHEQGGLLRIGIQPILKRSHASILPYPIRTVNRHHTPVPQPQTRNAFFTPMPEVRGTQRRVSVEDMYAAFWNDEVLEYHLMGMEQGASLLPAGPGWYALQSIMSMTMAMLRFL